MSMVFCSSLMLEKSSNHSSSSRDLKISLTFVMNKTPYSHLLLTVFTQCTATNNLTEHLSMTLTDKTWSFSNINDNNDVLIHCVKNHTLDSKIDVGPTFINFGFFSRPYSLIREYIKVIMMVIYYIGHVYYRHYVYSLPCVYFGG